MNGLIDILNLILKVHYYLERSEGNFSRRRSGEIWIVCSRLWSKINDFFPFTTSYLYSSLKFIIENNRLTFQNWDRVWENMETSSIVRAMKPLLCLASNKWDKYNKLSQMRYNLQSRQSLYCQYYLPHQAEISLIGERTHSRLVIILCSN